MVCYSSTIIVYSTNHSENIYGVGDLISAGKCGISKCFIFQIEKNKSLLTEVCGKGIGCGILDSHLKGAASILHTWWYTGLSPISRGNRKTELYGRGSLGTPVTGQELEASEECQSPTPLANPYPSLYIHSDRADIHK